MPAYKNVALVGASGSVGQAILNGLLTSSTGFKVTALVRAESSSKIPQEGHAALTIVRGDFGDDSFIQNTLTGQDSLVIALNATPDSLALQNKLVDAAAAVGVKRLIPTEFGSDVTNPKILEAVPIFQGKLEAAKHLEDAVAKNPATSWSSVINGPFFEWGLERNVFGFNPKERTAILYDNGVGEFDSINIFSLGKIISSILTTPDEFKNRPVFVSEFTISQNDIFEALLKATETTKDDWKIEYRTTQDFRKEGFEKLGKGDLSGILNLIFAAVFQPGLGSNFSATHKLDNAAVGLQRGNLEETIKAFLA